MVDIDFDIDDRLPYMRPPLSKELWFNEDKAAVEELRSHQIIRLLEEVSKDWCFSNSLLSVGYSESCVKIQRSWQLT